MGFFRPLPHIAILFEFGTLNGGEHSMLAAMDRFAEEFTFTAIAPPSGRLADALRDRRIRHWPFSVRDETGTRRSTDAIRADLLEAVRQIQPDLLHANSLSMGRLTGSVSERLTMSCVAHLRDIIGLSAAAVADLNRNHRLIAVSQATRDFHVAHGLDAAKTQVIYNGVDLERFQPRPATGWLKRELGLPKEAILIGTIGQIGLRKGQDVLAAAAARIGPVSSHLHFLLIGERLSAKPESFDFEQRIVTQFAEAGLSARLHQLGYRDDVPLMMNELDLLVHPAKQEPLGRVLLEALAAGLPVIATDVGGTREIIADGQTGWLVPSDDPAALAAAMLQAVRDPQNAAQMAVVGRSRAEMLFDIRVAAERLANAWREVLDR